MRSLLGGRISFGQATREAFRRGRAAARSRRERALLDDLASQTRQAASGISTLPPPIYLSTFANETHLHFSRDLNRQTPPLGYTESCFRMKLSS